MNIEHWIKNPHEMGADAVQQLPALIEACPSCATYRLLYVMALANVHSTRLEGELKRHAVALPDRFRLFQLINQGEYEWVNLMQQLEEKHQQHEEVNDFELIDKFLASMQTPGIADEGYSIDDLTQAVSMLPDDDDYTEDAPHGSRTPEDEEQDMLIDNFLQAEENGTLFVPHGEKAEMREDDPNLLEKIKDRAFLTESLAKVYVKQHKYEQALAIFSQLNLQFPKKNCYFADQIRFLEKVIAYTKTEIDNDNK